MDNESAVITPENKPFIATRFLPKTGQTISYAANDDGALEKGWAIGARFVTKAISGDDIVFDRATGLMWARNGLAAGGNNGNVITWIDALVYCSALNFAGFTDWRLPNIKELQSIINYGATGPSIYGAWSNFNYVGYNNWSSTTALVITTKAWTISFNDGFKWKTDKTTVHFLLAVRKGNPG